MLFTDGVGDIIFPDEKVNENFLCELFMGNEKSLKRYCKQRVRTEGTLVVWNI